MGVSDRRIPWKEKKAVTGRAVRYYLEKNAAVARSIAPLDVTMRRAGVMMPSARLQRVHLNAAWVHAYDTAPDERSDRYEVAVGYSVALQAKLMLVADIVREQELLEGRVTNLVEAGLRYQLSPLMVLTAGVGFGNSEIDFRVLFGFQYSLAKLPFFD